MNRKFFLLLTACTAATFLHAQPQDTSSKEEVKPPSEQDKTLSSYLTIIPKNRALDLKQAFDILRREKTAAKVFFQLTSGTTIYNIIDMMLMDGGTIVVFRYTTAQGVRLMAVPIEQIAGVSY